ncbi:MAG: Smr/MutS family protein [Caldimonas sp.]
MSGKPIKAAHLHELSLLRAALLDRRRSAEAAEAHERERAAAARHERDLFATTVGTVVSLRKSPSPVLARPRPPAEARQRQLDEAAALAESISDDFDAVSLLETDDALSFRRRGIGPDVVRKLRRGVWVLQAELDLHGLRRDEARDRLTGFLHEATRSGLRCVRVVHGKGNGSPGREPVLKAKVRNWLIQKNEVIAFTQARASEGGHGALIVLLRPSAA